MKFKIIIATEFSRNEVEYEGDLDGVKFFIKLKATHEFSFAAIENLDAKEKGNVHRWLVQRDMRYDNELFMKVFSFYNVDPELNIDAAWAARDMKTETGAIDTMLGGGKF